MFFSKAPKVNESSHEIFNFEELIEKAKEKVEGDDVVEKELQDEEDVK